MSELEEVSYSIKFSKINTIEASELLENFQGGAEYADIENIREELADIFIYGLLLSEYYNFNFEENY